MVRSDLEEILPATTVKRRFLELLTRLGEQGGMVTVTRNGVAAGVLMSTVEYESLIETLEILADPAIMRRLARARRSFARGRTLGHDDVWQGHE